MDLLSLPSALQQSERILIAGAGGGFDVYAGLPLYVALRAQGKRAFLANLSYTPLEQTNAIPLFPALYAVTPSTTGADSYFPERTLARFLARDEHDISVYALGLVGLEPVQAAYAHLAQILSLDAIVLVDGGTDMLLRGDERGLGTPAEDMVSLAAVNALDLPTRLVMCIGFGVDTYHGVCHANWLENVAALTAAGASRGVQALLPTMPEVALYREAVEHAERRTPQRPSIVNGSIVSAIEGHFGDVHRSAGTRSSELFISPLMALLWAFDLPAVARRNLYLDRLAGTQTMREVELAIEAFHASIPHRSPRTIPH